MNRIAKSIINCLLIIVFIGILLYSKGYRIDAESAANIYTEMVYMNHPELIEHKKIDNLEIFLFQQDDVLACSVVKNSYPFIYKSLNTITAINESYSPYSWFVDQSNFDEEEIKSTNNECINTYELFYNLDYINLNKIGNALVPQMYSFGNDEKIYQIPDFHFEAIYYPITSDETKSISDYTNLYVDHNQLLYFEDFDHTVISGIYIDNNANVFLTRYDDNHESYIVTLSINMDYLNKDTTSVKEVYDKKTELIDKLKTYFIDNQNLDYYYQLKNETLIKIVKEVALELSFDINIIDVSIMIENTNVQHTNELIPSTIEEYATTFQYNFVESELSSDELMDLTYRDVFDLFDELYRLIIKTTDGKYFQLFVSDVVNIGDDIKVGDAYFKFGLSLINVDDFNKAMETTNIHKRITYIINEDYELIDNQEDALKITDKMESDIAEYLGINKYSVHISVVTPINHIIEN